MMLNLFTVHCLLVIISPNSTYASPCPFIALLTKSFARLHMGQLFKF